MEDANRREFLMGAAGSALAVGGTIHAGEAAQRALRGTGDIPDTDRLKDRSNDPPLRHKDSMPGDDCSPPIYVPPTVEDVINRLLGADAPFLNPYGNDARYYRGDLAVALAPLWEAAIPAALRTTAGALLARCSHDPDLAPRTRFQQVMSARYTRRIYDPQMSPPSSGYDPTDQTIVSVVPMGMAMPPQSYYVRAVMPIAETWAKLLRNTTTALAGLVAKLHDDHAGALDFAAGPLCVHLRAEPMPGLYEIILFAHVSWIEPEGVTDGTRQSS